MLIPLWLWGIARTEYVIWTLISFLFYLISHIKCFSCTSSWVASLTAAVANTNFNEMNWRVRECPLLNIYTCGIFDWINTIWPDDMLCICNLKSDIGGNDVDGRGIAKVNAILDSLFVVVASIDVSLCVTLMASTHVSWLSLRTHDVYCIALYRPHRQRQQMPEHSFKVNLCSIHFSFMSI